MVIEAQEIGWVSLQQANHSKAVQRVTEDQKCLHLKLSKVLFVEMNKVKKIN